MSLNIRKSQSSKYSAMFTKKCSQHFPLSRVPVFFSWFHTFLLYGLHSKSVTSRGPFVWVKYAGDTLSLKKKKRNPKHVSKLNGRGEARKKDIKLKQDGFQWGIFKIELFLHKQAHGNNKAIRKQEQQRWDKEGLMMRKQCSMFSLTQY